MGIYEVRDNLKQSIAEKEQLVESYRKLSRLTNEMDYGAVCYFIAINIDELKVMLKDIEMCCEEVSAASWVLSPDRMGS